MGIDIAWDLGEILYKIEDDTTIPSKVRDIASMILDLEYDNKKKEYLPNIQYVDFSSHGKIYTHFNVHSDNYVYDMEIPEFIEYVFAKDIPTREVISDFLFHFSKKVGGNKKDNKAFKTGKKNKPENLITKEDMGDPIVVDSFSYEPSNPRKTFLSLTTKTYPSPKETEVLEFLPKNLKMDEYGNYYHIIGSDKPKTMFTSHLDTADREQKITRLFSKKVNGEEIISTDGNSILGADDKAGVTIMLYMMDKGVPGIYYFFIKEEIGGIGSRDLADNYYKYPHLESIERCISFDRRGTKSVITSQLHEDCCSDEFASALCEEYKKGGLELSLDPTGVFTDSASFLYTIPECTNISVGYMNEHRVNETQNMTYLENICKASVMVDWDSLPTVREIVEYEDQNQENLVYLDKFTKEIKSLNRELKGVYVEYEENDIGDMDGWDIMEVLTIDIDSNTRNNIKNVYDSLIKLKSFLDKYGINTENKVSYTNNGFIEMNI
jgi:hypothetical protein